MNEGQGKNRSAIVHGLVVCSVAIAIVLGSHVLSAAAMGSIPVSGDVSQLPSRWDKVVTPLSQTRMPVDANGQAVVSGQEAISDAEKQWGLTDDDIDHGVGAVWGMLTDRGDERFKDLRVWIVVANVDIMSQGPRGSSHFVTHKLCIVIDAATNKYIYAYTAGPKTYVDGGGK